MSIHEMLLINRAGTKCAGMSRVTIAPKRHRDIFPINANYAGKEIVKEDAEQWHRLDYARIKIGDTWVQ